MCVVGASRNVGAPIAKIFCEGRHVRLPTSRSAVAWCSYLRTYVRTLCVHAQTLSITRLARQTSRVSLETVCPVLTALESETVTLYSVSMGIDVVPKYLILAWDISCMYAYVIS